MIDYAVVEISGRQYVVKPRQVFEVDAVPAGDKYECKKVLLRASGEKMELGVPYLKDSLTFDVLGEVKKKKVRVATYHAKANTRKVVGQRATKVKLMLQA